MGIVECLASAGCGSMFTEITETFCGEYTINPIEYIESHEIIAVYLRFSSRRASVSPTLALAGIRSAGSASRCRRARVRNHPITGCSDTQPVSACTRGCCSCASACRPSGTRACARAVTHEGVRCAHTHSGAAHASSQSREHAAQRGWAWSASRRRERRKARGWARCAGSRCGSQKSISGRLAVPCAAGL
jgi:hypothetical protein